MNLEQAILLYLLHALTGQATLVDVSATGLIQNAVDIAATGANVCDMKWGRPVVGVARAGLPESRQG
ncbi:MAG: hypothetical protein KGY81_10230 [Phycisphaerae bacterium]|nr:hypothetical protein [Phycisphaerae bacterium]